MSTIRMRQSGHFVRLVRRQGSGKESARVQEKVGDEDGEQKNSDCSDRLNDEGERGVGMRMYEYILIIVVPFCNNSDSLVIVHIHV